MKLTKILASNFIKDFSSLFFSNIIQKIFGLIRELVVAFFLGSSILYANYLLIRVVADFFSQLTAGNALKANLLPKFTKLYSSHKHISLSKIFTKSNKFSLALFFLSQLIQTSVIFFLGLQDNIIYFILSFILSCSISFNFINTIFLTVLQARGQFFRYAFASVFNSFIFTVLLYPLVSFFSIIGLAISRLMGILTLTVSYIIPMRKEKSGFQIDINRADFNIPTLVLGNFANIILISSRFAAGLDGTNGITFFMYAVVILNVVMTAIVGNISTILLRNISIKRDLRLILYSLFLTIISGVFMIVALSMFSENIIQFIYQRGAFTQSDVIATGEYLYNLSYGFILLFISTILFQPFLSLPIKETKKFRLNIVIIFLCAILISTLFTVYRDYAAISAAMIVLYSSAIVCVLLSFLSLRRYLRHES